MLASFYISPDQTTSISSMHILINTETVFDIFEQNKYLPDLLLLA